MAPGAPRDPRDNRRGIAFMVISLASFVVNDALIKELGSELPLWQTIFIRGVFASLWVGGALWVSSVRLGTFSGSKVPVLIRGLLDCLATFCYIGSLLHLPLGNAVSINMASPLMVTALAVVVLKEHVDRLRWLAIIVGFGGVVLLVQPSADGFNGWALLCLFATLVHSVRDLVTRWISAQVPSLIVTLVTALTITAVSGVACLVLPWHSVSWRALGVLAAAALFLSLGYFFVIRSTRTGDLSVVAPFRYSGLPIALVIGWVVWGELPDPAGWVGIILLIGAGLYLLRRERSTRAVRASADPI